MCLFFSTNSLLSAMSNGRVCSRMRVRAHTSRQMWSSQLFPTSDTCRTDQPSSQMSQRCSFLHSSLAPCPDDLTKTQSFEGPCDWFAQFPQKKFCHITTALPRPHSNRGGKAVRDQRSTAVLISFRKHCVLQIQRKVASSEISGSSA